MAFALYYFTFISVIYNFDLMLSKNAVVWFVYLFLIVSAKIVQELPKFIRIAFGFANLYHSIHCHFKMVLKNKIKITHGVHRSYFFRFFSL